MLIHKFSAVCQICSVLMFSYSYVNGVFCAYRSKSSPGVSGINRSDGSLEAAGSDASTVLRNELESTSIPRDRAAMLEQRVLTKTNNKYVPSFYF